MTKIEQEKLLVEQADASLDLIKKETDLMNFLREYSDEHWLHIDTIRKMINDVCESVNEYVFLTKEMQRNMVSSKLDYEAVYENAYEILQHIDKVKELCGIE